MTEQPISMQNALSARGMVAKISEAEMKAILASPNTSSARANLRRTLRAVMEREPK